MSLWNDNYAQRTLDMQPSAIRAMAKHVGKPGVISFAAGAPNPCMFPNEAVATVTRELFADPKKTAQALQYGASEGYMPLREFIADLLTADKFTVHAVEVFITNGSQQALEFMAKMFVSNGDRIITSSPTYVGALQAFRLFEPEIAEVAVTGEELDMERLESELKLGAKFLYLLPDHGNPHGACLSLQQRNDILALARKHRVPIVEDQAYDQLQLDGERLPTLLELDRATNPDDPNVLYLGTFSKSLTPGFRVGWVVAPTSVCEKLVSIKQASDLNSSSLNQMIVNELARRVFVSHGEPLRDFYRKQRDAMEAALKEFMPEGTQWITPNGGMFFWLTLPKHMDAQKLQEQAFEDEKVIFVPGASFHPNGEHKNTLRLSFSIPNPETIKDGIERLAKAITRYRDDA